MSIVHFRVSAPEHLNGAAEVIPQIDGKDLTDLIHSFEKKQAMETREVSYGGLVPEFFRFGPMPAHFMKVDKPIFVLGCDCGEVGCWPLLASVKLSTDAVSWADFVQPHRKGRDYSAFGPFSFGLSQYEVALTQLEQELAGV